MPQKIRHRLKKSLISLENRVQTAAPKRRSSKGNSRRSTRNKRKNKRSFKFRLFIAALYMAIICALLIAGYVFYCYVTMPDIRKSVMQTRQPSTEIMAENGNDIAKFGNVYAEVIYPENLPKKVTEAIIATEDHRFYSHCGFDVLGFGRAMLINIFRGRYAQGASTITQQIAKNIFLTPNKTIRRKVQELLLSFWLESKFTKNQILALYLNRVYFGSGMYGVDAAAKWYFNKTAFELNYREAAILAGMLKSPNRYNPLLNRDKALKRADVVLNNLYKKGYLTEKQYAQAKVLPISNGQQYRVTGGKHFARYVYDEVNNYIGERSVDVVVMSTLDQKLQETAEKILRTKIAAAKDKNVTEGAIVIMDKSGAIKAMVGGVDYNRSQFNRAVQAKRQAGSAFKPFVYLTALQYGFTPNSKVSDKPLTIGKWKPENYTRKYYGDVTLDYALSHSLNVATAALSKELYLRDIAENAHNLGITTDIDLIPSMVLGTNSVRVIDMATAYASLANGGKSVWPYAINEITTKDGHQLYVRTPYTPRQIVEPQFIRQLTSMMEHVINRGTGQAARLPIFAAGKTGTTQNYRDAWFIGWTAKYIAAVWVGNDNNLPMKKVGGGSLPAQIWHDIMLTTVGETPALPDDDIGLLIEDDIHENSVDNIGNFIEENDLDENESPSSMEKFLDKLGF